jgi:hypothetical protein
MMKRYLSLTLEELLENERLWAEEVKNLKKLVNTPVALGISSNRGTKIVAFHEDRTFNLSEVTDEPTLADEPTLGVIEDLVYFDRKRR